MRISQIVRNGVCNFAKSYLDGFGAAYIEIRTGSPPAQTTDPDSGTLLATLSMDYPAFGTPVTGVATANPISDDVSADATGTAGHYRIKDGGGVVWSQGTVGTSGADINFDSLSFNVGDRISITSMTLTMPATN